MNADLAQAMKLIATASPGEHAFEYMRGIARAALAKISTPTAEGARSTLRIEYDNDTGPDDGYLREWWGVIDEALGETLCQCDDEATAKRILAALSGTQPKGTAASVPEWKREARQAAEGKQAYYRDMMRQAREAREDAQAPAPVAGEQDAFNAWVQREKENARERLPGDDWIDNADEMYPGFQAGVAWARSQAPAVGALSKTGWSAVLWSKTTGSPLFTSRPCSTESNAEGCANSWRKAYDPALFDVTVSPVFIDVSKPPVQGSQS